MKPKIFIGPMSKNIVDAVINYSNTNDTPIGLIPSRRQVDYFGGYVNNWLTKDFCSYVRERTKNILLVRDHAGPDQGYFEDTGYDSFVDDCKENRFDVIHIDVWKKYKEYNKGLVETIRFLNIGYIKNPNIVYEIGTEEGIRPTTSEELDMLLLDLKQALPEKIFNQIHYCVIQSGTGLKGNTNIGHYDQYRLIEMINVVHKHGVISKEHNGDYLSNELVKSKFENGLDSINIAPEFGQIETKIILEIIKYHYPHLVNDFYQICLDSKRWVKWVNDDFKPEENKEEIINICGHYVFSDPKFILMKNKIFIPNLDTLIQNEIVKRIDKLIQITK